MSMFQRYLAAETDTADWGISVRNLGFATVAAGDTYPPGKHPEKHTTLTQKIGRVLDEFQLVYITRGEGSFWSNPSGEVEVASGDLILVYKGIRHGYRPDRAVGWDEHWIGFDGEKAEGLFRDLFKPEEPILKIGHNAEVLQVFRDACELAKNEVFGFRSIIGTKALEIMARVNALHKNPLSDNSSYDEIIRQACCRMSTAIEEVFDSEAFAIDHGMSHTSFRRHFKTLTGLAPNQYLLELKLSKARSLLTNTTLPVQTIAFECGFNNALYFSRFCKQRTGYSPTELRRHLDDASAEA